MKKTNLKRTRRIGASRKIVHGTAIRPRLAVFRSNKYIYAQLINDDTQKTIVSASSQSSKHTSTKTASAAVVGKELATYALKKKIKSVVFDKRWYRYHGRIKILADAARESGLKF